MDVSRFDFACQKVLHHGFRLAKSHGHAGVEVEHAALVILVTEPSILDRLVQAAVKAALQAHLKSMPRVFGLKKIELAGRLKAALDKAESEATAPLITVQIMWDVLVRNSTLLRNALLAAGSLMNTERPRPRPKGPTRTAPTPEPVPRTERKLDDAIPLDAELDKRLKDYTVDMTAQAQRGELDPVIGRDTEVRRVIEILGRKKKNNPILLGEPGVGKSAVIEGLALAIASGKVPEPLKGRRVLSLDMGALLAGAKFRGEFEERLKGLVSAVEALGNRVVIFIDEIHVLTGTGNQEGALDAANLLKPALARGEFQCIGATTLDEFRRYIEKDRALERRFQPVHVEEPSRAACLGILRGLKTKYEIHHGVKITDEALEAAVDYSIRYVTHRKLPDKAIDLIDEAASRMRLEIDSMPSALYKVARRVEELAIERQAIDDKAANKRALIKLDVELKQLRETFATLETAWHEYQKWLERHRTLEAKRSELTDLFEDSKTDGDFGFAARLQYQELPLVDGQMLEATRAINQLQAAHQFFGPDVGEREIAEIVADLTKIPVGKLLADEATSLLDLEDRLKTRIFGQNDALHVVSQALRRSRTGVGDPSRPIGALLFLGPTGVGKTETARAVAAELFGDPSRMVRIDMSEYMEPHNVARLIGAPPGYVGYGEGGELTEAVRQHPFTVVLFDEIEKAHPRVLDVMLQLFDAGRLTDGRGRLVDFRNTVCIMTSNLKTASGQVTDVALRQSLSPPLRPEFVNRIDELIVFRRLGRPELSRIIARMVEDLNQRLASRRMRVVIGVRLQQEILKRTQDGEFGGRAIRRLFEQLVSDAVSDRILRRPDQCEGAWQLELDPDGGAIWTLAHEAHRYLPAASNH